MNYDFISSSVERTVEFGFKIGSRMKGGEVIGLSGPLGSGKTYLIKGIAKGAGAQDKNIPINSPTFVIVNEYIGRLDIYHIDAYRIASPGEFEMIGFDEFCYPRSVVLIEWADKVKQGLQGIDYVRIELCYQSQHQRRIHIENMPEYILPSK
jgi:tRNA threonylcarbamoyladenosine biosynthesis protein TsaE